MSKNAFGPCWRALRKEIGRLRLNRSGNISVVFALSLVPVVGMVGAAIDYTNALTTRHQLQDAADAGVLAAAVQLARAANVGAGQVADAKAFVQLAIRDNMKSINPDVSPVITPDVNAGKVSANVSVAVPTSFLRVLNIQTISVGVSSIADFLGDGSTRVEVALVLDATGSMGENNKLDGAKSAAKNLVDTLLPSGGGGNDPNAHVRVSVVPFSDYVNVGLQYAGANWLTDTSNQTVTYAPSCWQQCTNIVYGPPYLHSATCYSDGVPYDCSGTYGDYVSCATTGTVCDPGGSYQNVWAGCVGSRADPLDMQEALSAAQPEPALRGYGCNNPLARLDSRNAQVSAQIAALNPAGETYMAPGLLWGWRTLSPLAPFQDGKAYSPFTQKFIVLMTDGFNTRSPSYPSHEWGDTFVADKLTLDTCTAIKAAGIKVFTVSFQVYNNTSAPLLKACASDGSYYYDAITNAALQGVFQNIADKISTGAAVKVHLVN